MMPIIELLKYILLAVIQGISEVLPISSSGHLIIFQELLGMDISNMSLSIFLHIGSLFALIIFYRKYLLSIGKNASEFVFKKNRTSETKSAFKLFLLINIACIPAGVIGLLTKKVIENSFTNTIYIGINLIITSALLFLLTRKKGTKSIDDMTYFDAIKIGLFQAIGILPGISRSGITTIGGKVSKLKDKDAINFAFLLFIPVALGTGLLELIEIFNGNVLLDEGQIVLYIIGTIVSFMVTYLSLITLFKIINKGKLYYFGYYCLVVGLIIIITKLI